MGQLLNEMVSPHFYGLSIISNKVVRSAGAVIAFNFQWFGTWSLLGLAWKCGYYLFVYNTFYILDLVFDLIL